MLEHANWFKFTWFKRLEATLDAKLFPLIVINGKPTLIASLPVV